MRTVSADAALAFEFAFQQARESLGYHLSHRVDVNGRKQTRDGVGFTHQKFINRGSVGKVENHHAASDIAILVLQGTAKQDDRTVTDHILQMNRSSSLPEIAGIGPVCARNDKRHPGWSSTEVTGMVDLPR